MKHLATLSLVGLLTACAVNDPEPTADRQPTAIVAGAVCKIGPDGGPLIADRGIGGTGAPANITTSIAAFSQVADRGIGGTGIVGVITGFASVCVDGLEVVYDEAVAVDFNGTAAPVSALRAGQVVVIQADGSAVTPHARTISLRQEVSGRIEAMELGSGLLTVAGLPVSVPPGTWGANRFGLGDWVAVSGLPRADGVVVASRLDAAPSGVFSAHGRVVREGTVTSIGSLSVPGPMANSLQDGQFVTVTGSYAGGRKQPLAVTTDKLLSDPANYFGHSVNHLVMQAFVRVVSGGVWVNGRKMNTSINMRGQSAPDGLAVVSLDRRPDGSFSATGLHASDLRVHAAPSASRYRGSGLADTMPAATRHSALTTTAARTDASGGGSLTNFQPSILTTYLGNNASQVTGPFTIPASTATPSAGAAPAGTTAASTSPTGSPATNSVVSMPTISSPLSVTPATSPSVSIAPVVTSSGLAVPAAAAAVSPVATSPIVPPSATVQTVQPTSPALPANGTPQIESVYAPVISSTGKTPATSSFPGVRPAISSVLASRTVPRHTVSGSIATPTISLVTTVGVAASANSPPAIAFAPISAASKPSIFTPGRHGRH